MTRNFIYSCALVSALTGFIFLNASAEDTPTITVSKGDKIALNVSGLGGAEGVTTAKVVENDLTNSGYFTISPSAGYIVKGSAGGGSVQGQVVDHGGST